VTIHKFVLQARLGPSLSMGEGNSGPLATCYGPCRDAATVNRSDATSALHAVLDDPAEKLAGNSDASTIRRKRATSTSDDATRLTRGSASSSAGGTTRTSATSCNAPRRSDVRSKASARSPSAQGAQPSPEVEGVIKLDSRRLAELRPRTCAASPSSAPPRAESPNSKLHNLIKQIKD
jgi:hypothetical protein